MYNTQNSLKFYQNIPKLFVHNFTNQHFGYIRLQDSHILKFPVTVHTEISSRQGANRKSTEPRLLSQKLPNLNSSWMSQYSTSFVLIIFAKNFSRMA